MQVSGLHVLFQGNSVWRLLQGLLVTINISSTKIIKKPWNPSMAKPPI